MACQRALNGILRRSKNSVTTFSSPVSSPICVNNVNATLRRSLASNVATEGPIDSYQKEESFSKSIILGTIYWNFTLH